jgi:hypothetical protein
MLSAKKSLTFSTESLRPIRHNPSTCHCDGRTPHLPCINSPNPAKYNDVCQADQFDRCRDAKCPALDTHANYNRLAEIIGEILAIWPSFIRYYDLICQFCEVDLGDHWNHCVFRWRSPDWGIRVGQKSLHNDDGLTFLMTHPLSFTEYSHSYHPTTDCIMKNDTMRAVYYQWNHGMGRVDDHEYITVYMECDPCVHRVWFGDQTKPVSINPTHIFENTHLLDEYSRSCGFDEHTYGGVTYVQKCTYGDESVDCKTKVGVHIMQTILYWHRSHWHELLCVDPHGALFVHEIWDIIGLYAFGADFEHPLLPTICYEKNYNEDQVHATLSQWLYAFDSDNTRSSFRYGLWDYEDDTPQLGLAALQI